MHNIFKLSSTNHLNHQNCDITFNTLQVSSLETWEADVFAGPDKTPSKIYQET
jgi:hypothetical protein